MDEHFESTQIWIETFFIRLMERDDMMNINNYDWDN